MISKQREVVYPLQIAGRIPLYAFTIKLLERYIRSTQTSGPAPPPQQTLMKVIAPSV